MSIEIATGRWLHHGRVHGATELDRDTFRPLRKASSLIPVNFGLNNSLKFVARTAVYWGICCRRQFSLGVKITAADTALRSCCSREHRCLAANRLMSV